MVSVDAGRFGRPPNTLHTAAPPPQLELADRNTILDARVVSFGGVGGLHSLGGVYGVSSHGTSWLGAC